MTTTATDGREAPLRLVGRVTFASGMVAAVGVAFMIAMFASFAVGAKSAGLAFGWANDVLVMVSYALTAPAALALGSLLRPRGLLLSTGLTVIGLVAIGLIVFLQLLLVIGALTFEQQIGAASLVFIVLAAWFVLTGYLSQASGVLPKGLWMGIVGATYVGYPIWAFWLGRRLVRSVGEHGRPQLVITVEGSPNV